MRRTIATAAAAALIAGGFALAAEDAEARRGYRAKRTSSGYSPRRARSAYGSYGSGGGGASFYPNCSAVRAAGAAPIRVGQAGYSRKLDRDGDGVACE